jgi:hypothetical protein
MKLILIKKNDLNEKWNNNAKIHNTGENTDKTIDDLENKIESIKSKVKNIRIAERKFQKN